MELSIKQKVLVFGIMALVFAGSALVKQEVFSSAEDGSPSSGVTVVSEVGGEDETGGDSTQNGDILIVDVEGAVVYPGVVKIESGSRVYEAIDKAGGILDTADTRYVNLAEEVEDGTIIYIPYEGENKNNDGSQAGTSSTSTGLVNINTADKTELMTLPGIGESYAQAIIDYRESTGSFKNKEDIKNVSGIGDKKYAKLESLICTY